jgi:hypothetical protein
VLTHFGVEDAGALEVTIVAASGDDPPAAEHTEPEDDFVENWLITVENTWSLMTSPAGVATFVSVPAGTLSVVAVRGDQRIGPERAVVESGGRKHLAIEIPRAR